MRLYFDEGIKKKMDKKKQNIIYSRNIQRRSTAEKIFINVDEHR